MGTYTVITWVETDYRLFLVVQKGSRRYKITIQKDDAQMSLDKRSIVYYGGSKVDIDMGVGSVLDKNA